jgi:pimeloyl-ACP methyl ester carboxylesterase
MRWWRSVAFSCLMLAPDSATAQAVCRPPAGHPVRVSPLLSLDVVEWGGKGETLLFLSGAAMPAYVFDDFAPLFTDSYRVVGVTRRGIAPSGPSPSGYSSRALTDDVIAVMDSLGIASAHVVGWSFGGIEAVWLAVASPGRVKSVILLDSYDVSAEAGHFPPLGVREPAPPPFLPFDSTSALTLSWRQRRNGQPAVPLTAICVNNRFSGDGRYLGRVTASGIVDSLVRGMSRLPFASIESPVLAIFAVSRGVGDFYPNYALMGREERLAADSLAAGRSRASASARARLQRELPKSMIVEIPGANHALFLSHPGATYLAMRRFLEH